MLFSIKNMRTVHFYLSIFCLPFILMYVFTGLMVVCGFNQNAGAHIQNYQINEVVQKNDIDKIKSILDTYNIKINNFHISKDRNNADGFGISTPRVDVNFSTKDEVTNVKITKRKFWGVMLMMHKSKAGMIMNIFAFIVSLSVLFVYLAGFIMTQWSKNRRAKSIASLFLGFIALFVIYFIV